VKLIAEFSVRGIPITEGSKKAILPKDARAKILRGEHVHPFVVNDNPKKLEEWRADVKHAAAAVFKDQPIAGRPIACLLKFYFERPPSHTKVMREMPFHMIAPDTEKLFRACNDAVQAVIWSNDAQVALIAAMKTYAFGTHYPGVEAICWELEAVDAARFGAGEAMLSLFSP